MIAVFSGFWQCWLLFALGSLVVSRYRQSLRLGEEVALSVGLGTVITSAGIFLLLLGGIFQPVLVVSIFLLLTVMSARSGERLLRRVRTAVWEAVRANPVLSAVAFVLLIPHFLSGLTPEVEVDSLWYHLGVPQFYLIRRRLCEVPFCLPSHYPMNFHLQYVFSLLIGNDETAKIVVVFLFFPICTLIYSLTRPWSDRRTALFAVILYLSMIHHRLPVMVNVKSAVLLFTLLSTTFLWKWMEEKRESDFWISAFWCGIAMGTKFNALIFCLSLHTAVVFLWMACHRNWRDAIFRPIGYQAVGWTLLSPWMIKSYLYTGNPLYPLLSGLFGAREGYLEAMLSNDLNHGLNLTRSKTIGEYWGQVWHNVLWMTFNTDLLFFLIPVGLLLLVIEWRKFMPQILTGLVVLPLFTLLWGSDIGRLFSVTYGMSAVLIAVGIFLLSKRSRIGVVLFGVMVCVIPATFLYQKWTFCNYPQIDWHGQIAVSEQARTKYLLRHGIVTEEDLEVYHYIRENLSDRYNLYVYNGGYPFYLYFPKILSDAHFKERLDVWLFQVGPEETAERLRGLHVKYILRGGKEGWVSQGLEDRKARFEDFVGGFAWSVRKFENQEIFELRGVVEPR